MSRYEEGLGFPDSQKDLQLLASIVFACGERAETTTGNLILFSAQLGRNQLLVNSPDLDNIRPRVNDPDFSEEQRAEYRSIEEELEEGALANFSALLFHGSIKDSDNQGTSPYRPLDVDTCRGDIRMYLVDKEPDLDWVSTATWTHLTASGKSSETVEASEWTIDKTKGLVSSRTAVRCINGKLSVGHILQASGVGLQECLGSDNTTDFDDYFLSQIQRVLDEVSDGHLENLDLLVAQAKEFYPDNADLHRLVDGIPESVERLTLNAAGSKTLADYLNEAIGMLHMLSMAA